MSEGTRILIVDDDPQLQRLLQMSLKRQGYEVLVASTGAEAVASVPAFRPDLIIMDIMMPDMDGYEATKRIRRMPEGRDVPVIFLSALTQVEAKVKGLRVGGSDYVTKPVNLPELIARIEAHLRLSAPTLGRLLTVMGAKAGVGTTSFVVNLALALREQKKDASVIIVDWRRPVGDVALFLGLLEPPSLDAVLPGMQSMDEDTLSQLLVEYAPGIRVIAGATDPSLLRHMNLSALSMVLEVALTMADYVLVDTGSVMDWEELPMVSKDMGTNFCLVTPEITCLKRVVHLLEQEWGEEYEIHYVLNRDGMPGGIATRQIESHLGVTFTAKLPNEPELLTRAMNVGRPAVQLAPRSKYVRAIRDVVKQILA